MEMISTQKVISGKRVFLSPKLRTELDVTEGDYVSFFRDEDRIIVKKVEA